jgi:hypothetical protein
MLGFEDCAKFLDNLVISLFMEFLFFFFLCLLLVRLLLIDQTLQDA